MSYFENAAAAIVMIASGFEKNPFGGVLICIVVTFWIYSKKKRTPPKEKIKRE